MPVLRPTGLSKSSSVFWISPGEVVRLGTQRTSRCSFRGVRMSDSWFLARRREVFHEFTKPFTGRHFMLCA